MQVQINAFVYIESVIIFHKLGQTFVVYFCMLLRIALKVALIMTILILTITCFEKTSSIEKHEAPEAGLDKADSNK